MEMGKNEKMMSDHQPVHTESAYAASIRSMMEQDVDNIRSYLSEQQLNGNHFVAYPLNNKVSKEDLRSFETIKEAADYTHERSKGNRQYDFNLIERLERILAPGQERNPDKPRDMDKRELSNDPAKEQLDKKLTGKEMQNEISLSKKSRDNGLEM